MCKEIALFIIFVILLLVLAGLEIYLLVVLTTKEYIPDRHKSLYRLGDFVKKKVYREELYPSYIEDYPNSIAVEYYKKTKKNNDLDVLLEIIKSRRKQIPDSNALIIHMRIGDVIDSRPETVNEFLTKYVDYHLDDGTKHNYVKPLIYYKEIFEKKENDLKEIKEIILIGGFHYEEDHSKSLFYAKSLSEQIQRYFKKIFRKNIKMTLEIKENESSEGHDKSADEDFIYMASAKHFIASGGGFSDLLANLILKQDGIVYGNR